MTKKQDIALEFDYSKLNQKDIIFTDLIRINVNQETVVLDLGIRARNENKATITDQVIMTLPHFMRFIEVAKKSADDILKQLKAIEDGNNNI